MTHTALSRKYCCSWLSGRFCGGMFVSTFFDSDSASMEAAAVAIGTFPTLRLHDPRLGARKSYTGKFRHLGEQRTDLAEAKTRDILFY